MSAQEVQAALDLARADAKTEPGTETQVQAMQAKAEAWPGIGFT